jgi:phosphoglycerol transferase MdoB-like AlkP superfamily enzyme
MSMNAPIPARPAHPIRFIARFGRHGLIWVAASIFCAISTATRIALVAKSLAAGQIATGEIPRVLLTGLAYDFVTSLYLVLPFALYVLLAPQGLLAGRLHRAFLGVTLGLALFGLAYLALVEYFFFDEFNARFNFVAVEYLIYPHEVFVNIWESYPVARALLAAALFSLIGMRVLAPHVFRLLDHPGRILWRVAHLGALLAALLAAHQAVDLESGRTRQNRVADELAANGLYSFFSAALNSRLDYTEFYLTLPDDEAAERARRLVGQDNAVFLPGARNPLARRVSYAGPARLLHVIVVVEESLGAEFVGAYGDNRGLTPNLDRLARDSIVFTKTYASGTRTVRGLEAVTASFPPVPPESIVKRVHNENMFNWSTVMRESGYSPTFIYGGFGAFDNMNHYFRTNGYRVIDRSAMGHPRFSNIWGVSDEDLFRHAIEVYDGQHAKGELIFSVVMTTSNHKPFTFPPGVEGVLPKGGGRESGVRYADYALGKFVEELRRRDYFDHTLIVIVADHGARVYGKEEFPLRSFEIPFLVHAPGHVKPRRVDALTSQLDVAPTVLAILGISYDSTFFGRDALANERDVHLAPLNHNRDIAILEKDHLNQLGFRKTSSSLGYFEADGRQYPTARNDERLKDVASFFQVAHSLYSRGEYHVR